MLKRKLSVLFISAMALFALLLVGCGGGGGGGHKLSDPDQVAANELAFLNNWGAHNVNGAMGYVSVNFSENGMDYNGLRAAITNSPNFGVANFQVIECDIDTTSTWAALNASFTMTANGQSQFISGWTFWHKQSNGAWLLCGYNGRALNNGPVSPLATTNRSSIITTISGKLKK